MQSYTTLDLNDRQFLKIRAGRFGVIVYLTISELHPGARRHSWRSLRRETRADVLARMLDAKEWRPNVVSAMISNVIIDARRRWADQDSKI